jgi:16S rRNA (uracil1498-N3)-methyltransferase
VTRLQKVALAATKQCRRSYIPEIALPMTLTEFLAEFESDDTGLFFHPANRARALADIPLDTGLKRATLLIGPESGFSDEEAESAEKAGLTPVSLGDRILRTETAGPVAAALLMEHLGELR